MTADETPDVVADTAPEPESEPLPPAAKAQPETDATQSEPEPEPDPIAAAEARGRAAAQAEAARRMARLLFESKAERRNSRFPASEVSDLLRIDALLDDSGQPDPAAIDRAVNALVPDDRLVGAPSFDGGVRGQPVRRAPTMAEVLANAAMQSRWQGRPGYLNGGT